MESASIRADNEAFKKSSCHRRDSRTNKEPVPGLFLSRPEPSTKASGASSHCTRRHAERTSWTYFGPRGAGMVQLSIGPSMQTSLTAKGKSSGGTSTTGVGPRTTYQSGASMLSKQELVRLVDQRSPPPVVFIFGPGQGQTQRSHRVLP